MTRPLVAAGMVLVLVGGFLAVGAGTAQAAPSAGVTTGANDFTPSGSGARKFMINVLGSVLKGATPNKWKREQIANQYQKNFSWEKAEAELGFPLDHPEGYLITNGYLDNPQTMKDYELRKSELDAKGGKDGKANRVPATKMQKFEKTIGVASGVMIGAETGFAIGKGISENMGFDVDGGLCAPTFEDFGLIGMITGTDCAGYFDMLAEYQANQGVGATAVGEKLTAPDGKTFQVVSEIDPAIVATYGVSGWCSQYQTPYSKNYGIGFFTDAGVYSTYNLSTSCAGPAPTGYGVEAYGWAAGTPAPTRYAIVVRTNPTVPIGSISAPIEVVNNDPARQLKCTIMGTDGNEYTMLSDSYQEGADGATAAPECPVLPDGVAASNYKVEDTNPKAGGVMYDEDTTQEYRDWLAAYPECETGACSLDLLKLGTGSAPVSCFDVNEMCADWFADPNKTSAYQCTYGSHTVALEECNVYSGVFKPERLAVGAPYSDPETGEWSGGQSSPTEGSKGMGSPVQNPETTRNCWGTGWAEFNPVEWVMTPVKCSMEWAAVPRPSVALATIVKLDMDWKKTQLGGFLTAVSSYRFVPPGNGCTGIPVDVFFLGQFSIMAACPGDALETMAYWARIFGQLSFCVLGVVALSRILGNTVGSRGLGN